uniref:Uncharacterized protein n=1 Tax=Globisporangium ultimum (strain ATCC 200006 / CBS 805.95 / DAOM BR144) TaxID=431595 RepID=K3WT94_GLOUD
IVVLNVASTVLTLLSGLRENPLLVFVTGRYDLIRSRLIEGTINYDIINDEHIRPDKLTNLTMVGERFRFISSPHRDISNIGEDRSTCMRVNSINSSMLALHYDDFWGTGPRRIQIFLHSISAPNCKVINFLPAWYKNCETSYGNTIACQRYILDNFEALQANRLVQIGVEKEFGVVGVPFLKCLARPEKTFNYMTDMMVHQSYWAGCSYHIEIQSSKCLAVPKIRSPDWDWSLFKVEAADKGADVVLAIDDGWFTYLIQIIYGYVSVGMILHGIFATLVQATAVHYVTNGTRFAQLRNILGNLIPGKPKTSVKEIKDNDDDEEGGEDDNVSAIQFKGTLVMASDIWMNHWLYITLSIVDAFANFRMTYVVYGSATWILNKKINVENFLFICSALTRVTWTMCGLHSVCRFVLKLIVRSLKSIHVIRAQVRDKIEWYIDGIALFASFKMYSIVMATWLFLIIMVHRSASFMVKAVPHKRGVFGGAPSIANLWRSEAACDTLVNLSVLATTGMIVGSLLLLTRFKCVANNKLIQLMQQRYVLVGWDVFVTIELLGIEASRPTTVGNELVATTNCSFGAVLQQLYLSGPSRLVQLAGDKVFDGTFLRNEQRPSLFKYPKRQALVMGLYRDPKSTISRPRILATATSLGYEAEITAMENKSKSSKSLFERTLRLCAESRFGRILIVDANDPGALIKSSVSTRAQFVTQDLLAAASIPEIEQLLGDAKKVRMG